MTPLRLDKEYLEARMKDQEENAEAIQRADARFKLDARITRGKGPLRFVHPTTLEDNMKKNGFTLIEILIAIVIIGILSMIVIGKIMGAQQAATTVRCLADMSAFATEVNLMSLTGPAPTQAEVRDHIDWDGKYKNYWYIPNNKDANSGHGNDLDGCDEENPGKSLPGRNCIPMRFLIVCNHETHGNNSDAKYCFHTGGGMPPQIVPYEEFRHTYLQDAKWWVGGDPGFQKWIGQIPKK